MPLLSIFVLFCFLFLPQVLCLDYDCCITKCVVVKVMLFNYIVKVINSLLCICYIKRKVCVLFPHGVFVKFVFLYHSTYVAGY